VRLGLGRGGTSRVLPIEPALSLESASGARPGPRRGVHGELGHIEGRGRVSNEAFTLRLLPGAGAPSTRIVSIDRKEGSAGSSPMTAVSHLRE
jgi:hypothetical protein